MESDADATFVAECLPEFRLEYWAILTVRKSFCHHVPITLYLELIPAIIATGDVYGKVTDALVAGRVEFD